MSMKSMLHWSLALLVLAVASSGFAEEAPAFAANRLLAPGVNYGNVLEASPPEGWGLKVNEADFKAVAAAGFKSIRIPVRWSARAAKTAPYTIEPAFFALVDKAVNAALKNNLSVVLNMHHYDELFSDPRGNRDRMMGLWKQIAPHYAKYPSTLFFEILNEPHDKLTVELWNAYYKQALGIIRESNPNRTVIVDAAAWGGADGLKDLNFISGDKNLIYSFHHYAPFHFTHQGADWVGPESKKWLGTQWLGRPADIEEIDKEFKKAANFSKHYNTPIYMGEFGAYKAGDTASRRRWTAAIVKLSQRYGFSYAYWELKSDGFGIYDEKTGKWNIPVRDALLGK